MQAPWSTEGYLALALFLILIGFLSVRSLARGGVRRFWLGRLVRFFLPWLVWSAFFLALNIWRGGWGQILPARPLDLLIGPSIHLWFLPFVILASPLIIVLQLKLTSPARVWLAALTAVPLAVGAIWAHDQANLPEPVAQWAFATMPLVFGLLSAMGQHHRVTAAPLLFAILTCAIAGFGFRSPLAAYLLGAAVLFEILWRIDIQLPRLAQLGQLSFGIYLVHPFFILVWFYFGGVGYPPALGAVAVFAASAVCIFVIRLVPAGRLIS